jgi:hypothetical protein
MWKLKEISTELQTPYQTVQTIIGDMLADLGLHWSHGQNR